jgi:protein-tyrosine phosphatase
MTNIFFICHGNICRSPMAEFCISSAAASSEELGNNMHPGARAKLDEMNIPYMCRYDAR